MLAPKPQWLSYAVDIAQIVSAIFTACAVVVAIWLARRSESQRLRFYVHRNMTITPGRESTLSIVVTVVSAGVLKVTIRSVFCELPLLGQDGGGWLAPAQSTSGVATLPLALEHGQQIAFEVVVPNSATVSRAWSFYRRPRFRILTSLGKTYVYKPSLKLIAPQGTDW